MFRPESMPSAQSHSANSSVSTVFAHDYWGIDNDHAALSDVLLGRPTHYRWVDAGPLIRRTLDNAHRTGIRFDLDLALRQHQEMVDAFEENGVKCHYLEADEVLHRNFFARDNSVMTPWGALICHMQLKCRRADYATVIKFYQAEEIPIWKFATAGHFEGGDFVILRPGLVLIGYCGERSEKEGSEQVAEFVRAEGWEAMVAPISREFVHMDGLVVPLADNLLLACRDALEPWLVDWIEKRGFEIVDVDYAEAKNLGVNLVALGNDKLLAMTGAPNLQKKLSAIGFDVTVLDLSMFTLGGGGIHCLTQALRRERLSEQVDSV